MLRLPAVLAAAAAIAFGGMAIHVRAAIDEHQPDSATQRELLVFEVKNCTICSLVHTHLAPVYQSSTKSRHAPMRFVDLNEVDENALGLTMPITTVPTIVLMEQGKEVARITGYTGPDIFFQAMHHVLGDRD